MARTPAMKRNPLWDAQAKQFLASGVLPNALARQADPGVMLRGNNRMSPVPISVIDRPVDPAMAATGSLPLPRTNPVRPVNPMPPNAVPVVGTVGGVSVQGAPRAVTGGPPNPRVVGGSGFPSMSGVGFPGGGGRTPRRPQPAQPGTYAPQRAPVRTVANPRTPFQYRVSR